MQITQENFQKEVLESELPVLVDFYSEWCPPCKMLAPVIEELEKKYEGKMKIGKINVENDNNLSQKYQISSIPALVFFNKGEEKKRLVGFHSQEDLSKEIDAILESN